MEEFVITQINTSSPDYQELLEFRNELLRRPLGLNLFEEDLSDDAQDFILVAKQQGEIIGCVMLHPKENNVIKLRQMAVAEKRQGQSIGKKLVERAEQIARENDFEKIILHARITAKLFYEKLGYTSFGKEFSEVSIPHVTMEKTLS